MLKTTILLRLLVICGVNLHLQLIFQMQTKLTDPVCVFGSICPDQEEEVTLCMDLEPATLTPPTQQGDASGGSSPGQPSAEPITERKTSDVTSGLVQTLEEKEEEDEEGPAASMATN